MLYKLFPTERRNSRHVYARTPEEILSFTDCNPGEIKPVNRGYVFFYLPNEDSLNHQKGGINEEGVVPMAELEITSDFSAFVTQRAVYQFERAKKGLLQSRSSLPCIEFYLNEARNLVIQTFVPEDIALAFIGHDLTK